MKNYSLYTSQIGQEYVKPSELIDHETAMECVSHARELLKIYWMTYSGLSMLTGMTEEGLRHCIEMPEFQNLFQMLGSHTDLSNLSQANKEQAMAEITTFFNDPTLRFFLAQVSSIVEQGSQSLNQIQNQTHQDRQETP